MNSEWPSIAISFVLRLIINVISYYLFELKLISTSAFSFIIVIVAMFMLIMVIQNRYHELKDEIEEINGMCRELSKNLKIHERLTKLEVITEQYVKKK